MLGTTDGFLLTSYTLLELVPAALGWILHLHNGLGSVGLDGIHGHTLVVHLTFHDSNHIIIDILSGITHSSIVISVLTVVPGGSRSGRLGTLAALGGAKSRRHVGLRNYC